jgi:hypothetical protein
MFYLFFYGLGGRSMRLRRFTRDVSLRDISMSARIEAHLQLDEQEVFFQKTFPVPRSTQGTKLVVSGSAKSVERLEKLYAKVFAPALATAVDLVERFSLDETIERLQSRDQLGEFLLRLLTGTVRHPIYFPFVFVRLALENDSKTGVNNLVFLHHLRGISSKVKYLRDMRQRSHSYPEHFALTEDPFVDAFSAHLAGDFVEVHDFPELRTRVYDRYNLLKPHALQDSFRHLKGMPSSSVKSAWDVFRFALSTIDPARLESLPGLAITVVWGLEKNRLFPLFVAEAQGLWGLDPKFMPLKHSHRANIISTGYLYGGRVSFAFVKPTSFGQSRWSKAISDAGQLLKSCLDPTYEIPYEIEKVEVSSSHHLRTMLWQQKLLTDSCLEKGATEQSLKRIGRISERLYLSAGFFMRLPIYSADVLGRELCFRKDKEPLELESILGEAIADVFYNHERYKTPMSILFRELCKENKAERDERLDALYRSLDEPRFWRNDLFLKLLRTRFGIRFDMTVDSRGVVPHLHRYADSHIALSVLFRNIVSNALKYTSSPSPAKDREIGISLTLRGARARQILLLSLKVTNSPPDLGSLARLSSKKDTPQDRANVMDELHDAPTALAPQHSRGIQSIKEIVDRLDDKKTRLPVPGFVGNASYHNNVVSYIRSSVNLSHPPKVGIQEFVLQLSKPVFRDRSI